MSNKRWLYLITASVTFLFLGLIYAWSIFKAPLSELYPDWSISQMSLTFTISMSFFCLGGFAGGLLSKKLSIRTRLLIAAVVLFLGFFIVSTIKTDNPGGSLVMLYIFYGAFGGGGVGFAYNAIIGTINKWFPDKIGLASGIMLMGFGLGGLLLGSVVNSMIGSMGVLSTFRVLAIMIAVVCVIAAFIIKQATPEEVAAFEAAAAANPKSKSVPTKDYTPAEMLKTSKFWLMTIWLIVINSGGLLVINSAANIAVAYGGTAVLGMIVSLFNGGGRIIAGTVFDRKGRKTGTFLNNLFMLIAGAFLTVGGLTGKFVFIMLGLIFVGLFYGGCPTIASAFTNQAFGAKNFPTNFSISNFNLLVGATLGPTLSSILLEASGGDYITNFYAIIVLALIGLVLWVGLNKACDK